ncbi:MAG: hypothetical protein ACW99L_11785, partial [Promethearchaeota archaeon]
MIDSDSSGENDLQENIMVVCPTCNSKRELKIPSKIINQSKQLTTVSIPSGTVCEHSFQSFVDKNFKVRGYQRVDFEFAKMEFYEGGGEEEKNLAQDEQTVGLSSLPLFQDIINLLRSYVDDNEVLGSGIFTVDGNILYSSLPSNT